MPTGYFSNDTTGTGTGYWSSNSCWDRWTTITTTSTTTVTDTVWVDWSSDTSTSTGNCIKYWVDGTADIGGASGIRRAPAETPQERRAREQEERRIAEECRRNEAIYAQEQALRRAQEAYAEKSAERLLLDNVTPEQREQYRRHKHIVVEGRSGTRYRIRKGRIGNVDVVDRSGRILHRLCAHPIDEVPDCDTVLAQKLWLETNEDAFIKAANRHPPSVPFERSFPVLPALQ